MTNIFNEESRSTDPKSPWIIFGDVPYSLLGMGVELWSLSKYFTLIENMLDKEALDFKARVNLRARELKLGSDEIDDFYDNHLDEYNALHSTLPTAARASVLMLICSRVETGLTDICKSLESSGYFDIKKDWNSFSDRGIRKAGKYLYKNFGLHISAHPHWDYLQSVFKVRDCWVHAGGDTNLMKTEKKKRLLIAVNQVIGVHVSSRGKICMEAELFSNLVNRLTALWQDLEEAFRDNHVLGPKYWE